MQVLEWMEDGQLQPSSYMYDDILFFAQHSGGTKNAAVIKQRVGKLCLKHLLIFTSLVMTSF